MTREEFKAKVDAIGRSVQNMDTAIIVFTDGERHVTQCWTIQEGSEFVRYSDVHSRSGSPAIEVPYSIIADVLDYSKKEK